MKPRKKQEKPDESEHVRGVDDENHDQKSNTQEEDGGGYARPKKDAGPERPDRGGS